MRLPGVASHKVTRFNVYKLHLFRNIWRNPSTCHFLATHTTTTARTTSRLISSNPVSVRDLISLNIFMVICISLLKYHLIWTSWRSWEQFRGFNLNNNSNSRAVGIATSYGLDGRGSIPSRGKKFLSTPHRPDRLWGLRSFLSNGCQGDLSPGVKRPGREADHSHVVPRSRVVGLYLHLPICLHGIVLD
jgi:hypothetical protein